MRDELLIALKTFALLNELLALLGLGFFFLGLILLLCSAAAQGIAIIGIGLLVGGAALLALGLLLWFLICEPDECDWFALLWQAFAQFAPGCYWGSYHWF